MTKAAIRDLQKRIGANPDGLFGDETYRKLAPQSNDIRKQALQLLLQSGQVPHMTYGLNVKCLQAVLGITPTGVIDAATKQLASTETWASTLIAKLQTKTSKVSGGSSQVKRGQQALADLGFNPGPIDGSLGRKTWTAWKALIAKHGYQNQNVVDITTMLYGSPDCLLAVQKHRADRMSIDEFNRVAKEAVEAEGFDNGDAWVQLLSDFANVESAYYKHAVSSGTGNCLGLFQFREKTWKAVSSKPYMTSVYDPFESMRATLRLAKANLKTFARYAKAIESAKQEQKVKVKIQGRTCSLFTGICYFLHNFGTGNASSFMISEKGTTDECRSAVKNNAEVVDSCHKTVRRYLLNNN